MVRRISEWSSMVRRSRVGPRNRWQDEVLKDIRVLGMKNWPEVVMDRAAWHDLVEKSKTHRGFFILFIYLSSICYMHSTWISQTKL
jgi:hypothetical protein